MSLPTRMGLSLPVFQDLHKTVEMAKWGEDNGYEGLWIADSGDLDALTVSAVLATHTERVRIGTAVVPVYPRTPAGLASITTDRYVRSAQRFFPDLGVDDLADVGCLSTADVSGFVLRAARRSLSVGSAKLMVADLRALLRYLHVCGLRQYPFASNTC